MRAYSTLFSTSYRCDFRNRRQKHEYGYSLRRLASYAFPTFRHRRCGKVSRSSNSLICHELKRYVQFLHPNTLDRALSWQSSHLMVHKTSHENNMSVLLVFYNRLQIKMTVRIVMLCEIFNVRIN